MPPNAFSVASNMSRISDGIADVGLDGQRPPTFGFDRANEFLGGSATCRIVDHDRKAVAGQALRPQPRRCRAMRPSQSRPCCFCRSFCLLFR